MLDKKNWNLYYNHEAGNRWAPQGKATVDSFPMDKNSKTRIAGQLREKPGPCADHIFLVLEVRRPPWPHICWKGSLEVKEEAMSKDFLYPYAFLVKSFLAKRCVCTHGQYWGTLNMDCESDKSKWLAKGNLEQIPHKSNSNYHEGMTQWPSLSLSLPKCLSTLTVLFSS